MSGIIKKRSLKILIGSAIELIFTFVFAFTIKNCKYERALAIWTT